MMYNTGQEITIPYDHTLVMKNMQFRHLRLGFICRCELCQEEEIKNDDELYDKFQNLEEISEKIREKYYDNHPPTKDMMKNAKKLEEFLNDNEKALEISKQMYNLARIKRAPKGFIFDLIKNGIEHAADGYKNTKGKIENLQFDDNQANWISNGFAIALTSFKLYFSIFCVMNSQVIF